MTKTIVLATPHKRYDRLETRLRGNAALRIVRLREKDELSEERLAQIKPDFVFFPHWSWIIPAPIYKAYPCVIFHMTDVPFGRGGSPLQNLITRKIYETKLSAIACDAQLDAGAVYLKRPLSLDGSAEEIFARAAELMEEMIVTIATRKIEPVPQAGEPTVFARRTPEQSDIAGLKDLTSVHDHIRMLDAEGYPHAFLSVGKLRLEFTGSHLSHDSITANVKITLNEG